MAVYQDKAIERIKAGLRKYAPIIEKQAKANANEADTRTIVSGILGDILGWDMFEQVTGEYRIRGNYADYVIRAEDGNPWAVVEVKSVGTKLNSKHLYQASGYAANEGIDWMILTNGDEWVLYRVIFNKPITQDEVFRIRVTDPDKKPAEKAKSFYLLSREAPRKNELEDFYTRKVALCGSNVAKAILSATVLKTLRAEMRKATGHLVSGEDLAEVLVNEVLRQEVQDFDVPRLIKKATAPVKK